jgi:SAM-dependent methyltransferase
MPRTVTVENRTSFGSAPDEYRKYRPQYPRELFAYLAGLCDAREAALDCATGNGQAAIGLADDFAEVDAFDASREQVAAAIEHPGVKYRVASAEDLPYPKNRFDLVTIAQGAHWFDLPEFYAEVLKVAKRNAIIAIWGYSYCIVTPDIDAIVARELLAPIGSYWAQGNRVIMERYRNIEFPFAEIEPPTFVMTHDWDRETFMGYLRTWSAYKRYVLEHERDPVEMLAHALRPLWADGEVKPVGFELVMRIGRIA